jgi:flagellar FliJ protein
MRFRYSLQKIVDLKANETKQAEWLLSDAVGQLSEAEHSLQELEGIRAMLQELLIPSNGRAAAVHELQAIQQYLMHVDKLIEQKLEDVRRAQSNVQDKQRNLSEKMRDEKVWNRAKEQAYNRFLAGMRRREQQELDEIASARFERRAAADSH